VTDMDSLEALSGSVRKSLHWCVFLLAAMIVILVIDLQIKKSIARQAVRVTGEFDAVTARLLADMKGEARGRSGPVVAPADDVDHGGGGRRGDVDGRAGVAAGDDQAAGPGEAAVARGPAGRVKRAPGNGRRASGADS